MSLNPVPFVSTPHWIFKLQLPAICNVFFNLFYGLVFKAIILEPGQLDCLHPIQVLRIIGPFIKTL